MLSTGQLPTFEHVYRGQFDFVLRTLRAMGVPESGLDDAVQDVFIVVHRRLPEFEGRASIKTWAYEIARRVALRYRTRAARHASRHTELPPLLRAHGDLDEEIEHARAAEVLQVFLGDLDEDRRRAFVLAELWEMSGREIAESLGVNMNTVYARIRSARTELDRVAHRIRARDAASLTRALRDQRASVATRARARAGVLLAVGGVNSTTAGVATLAWAGLAAVVCGLGAVAAVALRTPEARAPEAAPAPAADVASVVSPVVPSPRPVAAVAQAALPVATPPSPSARVAPRPPPKPASSPSPSLSEQLAAESPA